MSANDRQRQILEHIAQSAEGLGLVSSRLSPTPPTETVVPQAISETVTPAKATSTTPEERKRRMLSHVEQSSRDFDRFSLEKSDTQKSRVLEHLRKSLSSEG